jgi:integrase
MGSKDEAEARIRFAQWLLLEGQSSRSEGPVDYDVAALWAAYKERHVDQETEAPKALDYAWRHLAAHFGPLSLTAIDQSVVDSYTAKRAAGRIGHPSGKSTVRRELTVLRSCLNWCAKPERKIILPSQLPLFNLPPAGQPRDRWLKTEEIERLLAAATTGTGRASRGERFLRLALETAARKTALFELTWDRVDFETGMIHLAVPGRRRTKKRRANVPISKTLLPHLLKWHAERINDLVLDNSADVWAAVQSIARRAGFGEPDTNRKRGAMPKRTGISPHVMRHTAATQMARRGVPLYDIAGVLGNSLAMVQSTYAHHCPDRLRDAVNRISENLGASAPNLGANTPFGRKMHDIQTGQNVSDHVGEAEFR